MERKKQNCQLLFLDYRNIYLKKKEDNQLLELMIVQQLARPKEEHLEKKDMQVNELMT